MNNHNIENIRNIGIIAHIDAGKTTATERILYYSGSTYKMGNVDNGNTVTDWMAQEQERGITIVAAATSLEWQESVFKKKVSINIIDTPGHIDFTAEVIRSLRVLDGGVVVFDASAGVEPQSETVWRQADDCHVPRICFINKMDKIGADFDKAVESIIQKLGANPVPIQIPIGKEDNFEGIIDLLEMKAIRFSGENDFQPEIIAIPDNLRDLAIEKRDKMIEKIAESDELLTDKYLEGVEISKIELYQALRDAVLKNTIVPVLAGSALHNSGIQPLLDAVVQFLPSPVEVPPVVGTVPGKSEKIIRKSDNNEYFSALIFKNVNDSYTGQLSYVRVYSGTLKAGDFVYNTNSEKKERIGRLFKMQGGKQIAVDSCHAGDICAMVGLKHSHTGETLSDYNHRIILENIEFPEPVIKLSIEPVSVYDQENLGKALAELVEEDPTLKKSYDKLTGQTIISGMGELHLEIIVGRLQREYEVKCKTGRCEVAYRETITKQVNVEGKWIQQSGGHGQYAVVELILEPNERGSGFAFKNKISGGLLPENYIPSIQKGIEDAMKNGIIDGYPVVDVKVTLVGGKFHDTDSSKRDFEIAGSIAFKEGMRIADPVLLEPVMSVVTVSPEEYLGSVMKDFARRRGAIEKTDMVNAIIHKVLAKVPLKEMLGYITDLRSMTSGRGSFSMEFDHFEKLPGYINNSGNNNNGNNGNRFNRSLAVKESCKTDKQVLKQKSITDIPEKVKSVLPNSNEHTQLSYMGERFNYADFIRNNSLKNDTVPDEISKLNEDNNKRQKGPVSKSSKRRVLKKYE